MKRFISLVLVSITLLAIASPAAEKADKGAEQIKKAAHAWDQAYIDKNTKVIENTLSDDFVGIWPDGSTTTKAEELAQVKVGQYKLFSVKYEKENVRLYGKTAVATTLATIEHEDFGKREKVTGWTTGVWIKQNGAWKLVSMHASLLKPAN